MFLRMKALPAVLFGNGAENFVEQIPTLISVRHDHNSLPRRLSIRLQCASKPFVRASMAETQLVTWSLQRESKPPIILLMGEHFVHHLRRQNLVRLPRVLVLYLNRHACNVTRRRP